MSNEELIKLRDDIEKIIYEIPARIGNLTGARSHLGAAIDYLNQEIGENSHHD